MTHKEWISLLSSVHDQDEKNRLLQMHNIGHPDRVQPVPRLPPDLKALKLFFVSDEPVKLCVRYRKCIQAIMGIGDAAKSGFGDSFLSLEGISYSYGTWNAKVSEQSSNFREFCNFLDSVRQEGEQGRLKDSLMFFATDNGLVESAIYKGTSDSSHLLDMVIECYAM